ncbi:MAG: adenylosuccinate synthetase, partial [Deltaproteobacteria bacterium CG_4_10_14_3_um_filter_60_8]
MLRTLDDPEVNRRTVELFSHVARAVRLLDEEGVRRLVTFGEQLVLEGAQGVLLDEDFGFHPYTTWSRTTFAHADELLDEVGFEGARVRLGVLRTYGVRHGPGPFPSE